MAVFFVQEVYLKKNLDNLDVFVEIAPFLPNTTLESDTSASNSEKQ